MRWAKFQTDEISGETMSETYTPPKVWKQDAETGGKFASINKPTAGAQFTRELPRGEHPLQLYSLGTPNGIKVTMLLEELLAAGESGAEYDAWLIRIGEGDQFGSGFVDINPNSKIPALLDVSTDPPTRVFESGAIMLYLAEKFGKYVPMEGTARAECLSWLFFQMGSAPYIGGGFGHFYHYAPVKIQYAVDRFTMETKRLLDVIDKTLADRRFLCGDEMNIADIANFAWFGNLLLHNQYEATEFLQVESYESAQRWAQEIQARPAIQRGRRVNKVTGPEELQVAERHSAADIS
jgi:GST-like protein